MSILLSDSHSILYPTDHLNQLYWSMLDRSHQGNLFVKPLRARIGYISSQTILF